MCRGFVILGLILASALGGEALAEPPEEETYSPLPPADIEPEPWVGEEEPLLAGPRQSEEGSERTLVRFEFRGNLRRLDRTAEEAALDALTLSADVRARAAEVVGLRWAALEESVRDEPDVLLDLQLARRAAKGDEARRRIESLRVRVEYTGGSVRLRDSLSALLEVTQRREFNRMIEDYERAVILDEVRQAQDRRDKLSLEEARLRVDLAKAGLELRRAFERRCRPLQRPGEHLLAALDLSEQQQAKVATPVRELMNKTREKPSARELFELTLRIAPELEPSQRRVWADLLLGVAPLAAGNEVPER